MDTNAQKVKSGFFQCLSKLATCIDDKLRFSDFKWNRTAGGQLDHYFGIRRHSYPYLLLPSLVAAIIVLGIPECCARLLMAVLAFIAVFFLMIWLSRLSMRRKWSVYADLMLQIFVVLAVAGAIWATGGDSYRAGIYVYRHFFILAAVIVAAALLFAGLVSFCIWKGLRYRNTYQDALKRTELFISRGTVITPNLGGLIRAFVTVAPGAPLQLLIIPSILVLLAPENLLTGLAIFALAISYGILLMSGFDARLNYMWSILQNIFFRGGALIVSLIIIVLAVCRLLGVSYVTTLLDTAERVVIFILLFSAYVLLWWYDYWVNRLLAQELLKLLNPGAVCDAKISYPIDPNFIRTSVLPENRVLQIHGSSRFIVIGSSNKDDEPRFQAHDFEEMFDLMASSAFPGGKAKLSPAHVSERILDFKYITAAVLIVLSVAAGLYISSGTQQAQLIVENQKQPELKLVELLENHSNTGGREPALIIAASGGGTRAALYTAAVLEGLARSGRIKDVALGSGVSGGGAALAYFAGRRPWLVSNAEQDWNNYFKIMSMPFIQDVINGAVQWRTVSGARLGVLLSESFEGRWQLATNFNKLGDVKDFGLILNTAIAGRFESCSDLPLVAAERRLRDDLTRTEMAGGRLILTNLHLGDDFVPSVEETGGPAGLPVVVHDPATRLEVAAALNANFPPVFSNAAIDIGNRDRYWVTDGGAIDNRGIEMPLYALMEALQDEKYENRAARLPAVTIVILDASAFSNKYSQDRGVGTIMGAGTQYASLLVEEQIQTIRTLYKMKKQPDDFQFIYLPMPLCLRQSGSFGTHWMLQPNIEIVLATGRSLTLKGHEMIDLLRAMHSPGGHKKLSPAAEAVLDNARKDPIWLKGARELKLIP